MSRHHRNCLYNWSGESSTCNCTELFERDDAEQGYALDPNDYDPDDTGECYWCGGEGWDECRDPIQCTREHNELGEC